MQECDVTDDLRTYFIVASRADAERSGRCLCVLGLSAATTSRELRRAFARATSAAVIYSADGSQSLRYGFVQFASRDDAAVTRQEALARPPVLDGASLEVGVDT